jgi:hypothetical protein
LQGDGSTADDFISHSCCELKTEMSWCQLPLETIYLILHHSLLCRLSRPLWVHIVWELYTLSPESATSQECILPHTSMVQHQQSQSSLGYEKSTTNL